MSLESPATYAEWYFHHELDAKYEEQKTREKELSALSAGVISDLKIRDYLPDEFKRLFDQLVAPTGQYLGEIGGRFVSEVADGAVGSAASPFFESMGYAAYMAAPIKKLTPATAALLFSRGKITEELLAERFRMGGFEPIEARFVYDSMRPYPNIPEIMLWARYHGDPDNIRDTVWEKFDVSVDDFELWEWLSWQKLTTEQCQTLFKRGAISDIDFYGEIARIGWHAVDREAIRDLAYTLPNSMLMVQGGLMQDVSDEKLLEDISKSDIHPDYARTYLDAILTKPASEDIIAYELRQDSTLSDLERKLRQIGIHPAYAPIYRELAYQIPPIADIITMAVREAFTPSIAARFGQYEDFPSEFEEWAAKKGLSKEWAMRYWAAHWNLPSPQQGFEMLHRGVIDSPTLEILLRAQDVMPFWRDKLIAIAYRPLTRVDVRRMYKEGVLDEGQVYESYLEQGYNEKNAERMAEFTVRQTLSSLSKFTSSDIIKAFTQRMISQSDAMSLLRDIGIRNEDASYIVATAEYKRQWEFIDSQIAGIKNLYKKRVYDDSDARGKLAGLNLPSEQIEVLMQQWFYDVKAEPTATWTTAQTLSFLKKGLIEESRARRELMLNGYDEEHTDIYIRNLQ